MKHSGVKMAICLGSLRTDNREYNVQTQLLHVLLVKRLKSSKSVKVISNENFLIYDTINKQLFRHGFVHFKTQKTIKPSHKIK